MAKKNKAHVEADGSAKTNKPSVPSVEKALDVIEYLSETKDGATMKELIQGLDRTMGELYRIVVYLTEKEYLTLDIDTGRYSLTLKLFELSHRHDPVKQLISHAVPLMQRFSAMTEQSCHLGVLSGDNLLVLASESSPRAMGYSVRTGALFHMTDASSASVIVAHSEDDLKQEYLSHFSTADAQEEARQRLKQSEAKRYEVSESPLVSGVLTLSVPIFNMKGVCAALTCGFIVQKPEAFNSKDTLKILCKTANELSRSLGAVDLPQ